LAVNKAGRPEGWKVNRLAGQQAISLAFHQAGRPVNGRCNVTGGL
jgi:hypothetical protein